MTILDKSAISKFVWQFTHLRFEVTSQDLTVPVYCFSVSKRFEVTSQDLTVPVYCFSVSKILKSSCTSLNASVGVNTVLLVMFNWIGCGTD